MKHRPLPALALCLLFTSGLQAETYVRDYTYKASDVDSKVTSRANALDQVKVILLQEIGTHIRQQIRISQDSTGKSYATEDIEAITAGLTKTEILEEKWDGETYYLKAKIVADTERVLNALEEFKKDRSHETQEQLRAIKENQRKLDMAREEVALLKAKLAEAEGAAERERIAASYTEKVKGIALWEPKTAFDGRVGSISISNDALYPVNVTLWHPDSKAPFKSYSIPGQSEVIIQHGSAPINIGGDWGVQIGGRNSAVRTVVDVSSWSSARKQWRLRTDSMVNE